MVIALLHNETTANLLHVIIMLKTLLHQLHGMCIYNKQAMALV